MQVRTERRYDAERLLSYVSGLQQEMHVETQGLHIQRTEAGPEVSDLASMERTAWARHDQGGRRKGERRRLLAQRTRLRAIAAAAGKESQARAALGMKRYLQQGVAMTTTGVSGRPVAGIVDYVYLEIGDRATKKRKVHRSQPRISEARRAFLDGHAPDRWGRWRVDRVMEVRRPRSGDRGRNGRGLEARIRWHGQDPNTGMSWPDLWSLVIDAGGTHMLDARCVAEAKALEKIKYGESTNELVEGDRRTPEASKAAANLKWRKALRVDRDEGQRDTGEAAPWWYMVQLRGGAWGGEQGDDLPLPKVTSADEWRRLALDDIKRRRAAAGDALRGARARKGQRVVWSDSDGDESESGRSAGALGKGGVDERLGGGSPTNDASMKGSAGDDSVAEAAEAAERSTGLDGERSHVRA